jgi:hypothetical protein
MMLGALAGCAALFRSPRDSRTPRGCRPPDRNPNRELHVVACMRILVSGLGGLALLASASGVVWATHRGNPPSPLPADARPVIVELFSSEGCSSCPPAEAWLAAVDRGQSIDGVAVLALEEHVDYWDRLGWRDMFALPQFSERQRAYSRVLADTRVFTPEVVIDGHAVVENGDEDQAAHDMRASAAEPRARVDLVRHGDHVTIDVSEIPGYELEPSEVWLAITESGLASTVTEGENAGKRLAHAPVVRALHRVGVVRQSSFHGETALDVDATWAPRALRIVAFVPRARSKRIVGANAL